MKNLYDQNDVAEMLKRIDKLTPEHQRNWGKMDITQMLAHCNVSMDTALGKSFIKRVFIGRIIGILMKPSVLGEKPFGKNSPTDKSYIISDKAQLDFAKEKNNLKNAVIRFNEGGPSKCTTHPHPFFGKFTPGEWAVFQWKHLDHHLKQFGV